MTVERTTLAKLVPAERAEIEATVAEAIAARPRPTDAFVSDEGDTMVWYAFAFAIALGGLVAVIVERATAYAPRPLFELSLIVSNNPTLPGLVVTVPVLVFIAATFLRVHKRHGWMATTFGVVRLRGQSVRVLRYVDVARAVRKRVGAGRPGAFSVLDLVATDGSTMTTYATRLMDTIQSRVPPTAINERPT